MSIFGSILSKIFGTTPASAGASAPAASAPAASAPAASAAGAPIAAAMPAVDVEAVMTDLATKNGQGLNWRQSIVDLMKLLDLDSSLAARKQLAGELHYGGDTDDSATMNVWLHRQVMQKLAENGGKVPDALKG